jgi:RNA polymerase sigma-70 factor, ECF subfamily
MSFLREVELGDSFGPFVAFKENFGFVPNIFRAQTLLPRVIEAQAKLESTVLLKAKGLSSAQKGQILLTVAAVRQDTYCVTRQTRILSSLGLSDTQIDDVLTDYRRAGLSAADVALLDFGLKLSRHAPSVHSEDIEGLRTSGFEDESILEALVVIALASYVCTLSVGLGLEPDFEPRKLPPTTITPQREVPFQGSISHDPHMPRKNGPYLRAVDLSPETFAPFAILQKTHGFIPNFFRAQTLRPDLLEAEVDAVGRILLPEDVLSRVQKECILLAVSAANLNSYCVAVHCNLLRGLGISLEEGDQIAVDHHQSNLPEADKALLDFALKVGVRFSEFSREDVVRLRALGFSDEQILECEVVTALNNFANTLQMGLGTLPDFEPRQVFIANKMYPLSPLARRTMDGSVLPSQVDSGEDADAGVVARVQGGNLEAFEDLVRRHGRRVYRTLAGILGNPEEAQDATQDAFLKAFEHIGEFQGRSKFSTWLLSIARNTGLQRLRERENVESLDEGASEGEEEFRPRQVRAWQENPEQLYSQKESRELVEKGVMGLPAKYRVVVMLRDIEQLSTEEVAQALGRSVPGLKARLLRGRLMLRESLTPHFTANARRTGL